MRLVIDVGDVLMYLAKHKSVSGIQRVAVEVWDTLKLSSEVEVIPVAFDDEFSEFYHVDKNDYQDLIDLIKEGTRSESTLKLAAQMHLQVSKNAKYSSGSSPEDVFFVLGAAWIHYQYFIELNRLKKIGVKICTLIYDLIPVNDNSFPESGRIQFERYIVQALSISDFVLSISHATGLDIQTYAERVGLPARSITVTQLPGGIQFRNELKSGGLSVQSHNKPYVLCVGTIETRKNHILLAKIWQKLIETHPESLVPDLICVGRLGWNIEPLLEFWFSNIALQEKMHFYFESVDDEALKQFYEGCEFTIYPSFYEGWGLPVSESLDALKPVLASNSSSIPEAGGEFATYFDPLDFEQAYNCVEEWILNPSQVAVVQKKIIRERVPLTWTDVISNIQAGIRAVEKIQTKSYVPRLPLGVEVGLGRIMPFPLDSAGSNFFARMQSQRVLPLSGATTDLVSQSKFHLGTTSSDKQVFESPYGIGKSGSRNLNICFNFRIEEINDVCLVFFVDTDADEIFAKSTLNSTQVPIEIIQNKVIMISLKKGNLFKDLKLDLQLSVMGKSPGMTGIYVRSVLCFSASDLDIWNNRFTKAISRNSISKANRQATLEVARHDELLKVYASASWRLTAPIRRIHKIYRLTKLKFL